MQVYTKILIGMGVGAVIGLTLGPSSSFLPADTYKVTQWERLDLRVDRQDESTAFNLPKTSSGRSNALRLDIQEVLDDAKGQPEWARVRLPYTEQLALRDKNETLKTQLGVTKVGQQTPVWLRVEHMPLSSGGVTTWPEAQSGLGITIITWLRPLGDLFMRLIKMVIVPLVFSSLLVGVASLGDVRRLGRLGARTLGLYMVTTAAAVILGLVIAHLLNPGSFIDEASRVALQAQFNDAAGATVDKAAEAPSMIDNILNIIPSNPIESLASGNMLQVIFFAVIFGIALTFLDGSQGRPVVTFFDRVQNAMVVIIHMVMSVAPFGVAALIADVVGTSGLGVLKGLLMYGVAVLLGLALHTGLVYGALVRFVAKIRLRDFFRAARPAQLIAFSTSSSSAALPVTMECAEESLGVSNPVASFVIPLGSTVNMDGTALYQGVAAIFIAQVFQMDLSLGAEIGIVATATMASVGAAGVPGAGMVTLAMVLTQAGIPTVGVALILGMDRLLDMFRTTVNVTGDLAVTAVMAVSEGEALRPLALADDKASPQRGFEHRLEKATQPVEPAP